MKITGEVQEGICLITLDGQIVGGLESMQLKAIVQDNLDKGVRAFMINMSQAEWFNSTGLGILISCLRLIKEARGALALFDINDKVRSLLAITKLITMFDRFDTQEQAEVFLKKHIRTVSA
jgi:anti-sigma B factor antagonist